MSVELATNMEDESPTRYMLSEGSVRLPKREKEEDAIIVKATVGQKRKRTPKKEKAEKKPQGQEDQTGIRRYDSTHFG